VNNRGIELSAASHHFRRLADVVLSVMRIAHPTTVPSPNLMRQFLHTHGEVRAFDIPLTVNDITLVRQAAAAGFVAPEHAPAFPRHAAPVHHAPAPLHYAPLHYAPAPVHHAPVHHAPVHHAPVHHAPVHHAPVHHAPVHHVHGPAPAAPAPAAPAAHIPPAAAGVTSRSRQGNILPVLGRFRPTDLSELGM
jgi:hypothetical protein